MEDFFEDGGVDPLLGQVVQDRYRIERRLGQGGMGAIYLAEHVVIQKKVAIKCLHAGLASNTEIIRRFHNEAVAATAIGHPNIVDVTDMGRFDNGTFFMVLEYLSGRDFQHDLDRNGAQPLGKIAHIGMQLCDALGAAAAKGIVHRDLKPENIFLVERHGDPNFVKVLDFGISKFRDGVSGGTKTGELMGTPYYMAPEQVRGERDISYLADIYSLGVIFYQALTGTVPFEGTTLPQLILRIAQDPAPPMERYRSDLPEKITALVGKMLAKDPSDRPQSFSEVSEVLSGFLSPQSRLSRPLSPDLGETTLGGSASVLGSGAPPPERPRRITPVALRSPDTSAGGTPGAFGHDGPAIAQHADRSSRLATLKAPSENDAPTTSAPQIQEGSKVPQKRKGSSSRLILIAASLFALGAIVFFVFGRRGGQQEGASTSEGSVSSGERVRVQIATLPPDAELFLDGKPISNPFDSEIEKRDAPRQLLAKRDGFSDEKRRLVFTSSQRIFVPMKESEKSGALDQSGATEDKPSKAPAPPTKAREIQTKPHVVAPAPAPTSGPAPSPTPIPAPSTSQSPSTQPSDLKKIF